MQRLIEKRDCLYSEIIVADTEDGFDVVNRGRLMSRWDTLAQASIERERAVETIAQMERLRELQHSTRNGVPRCK